MNFDDELDLGSLASVPEILPQVIVVNGTSKAATTGGKVGLFNVTGTDTNFKSFTATPLAVKTKRIWFQGKGTSTFCRSDNSVVPIQSGSASFKQQAPACNVCPKGRWKGRNAPPECATSLDVTMASLTDGIPKVFELSFKNAAMKDIKTALEMMSDQGGLTHNKFTIETQVIEGKSFDYYIPVFGGIVPLTEEERTSILPLITQYSPKTDVIKLESTEIEMEEGLDFSSNKDLVEIDLD